MMAHKIFMYVAVYRQQLVFSYPYSLVSPMITVSRSCIPREVGKEWECKYSLMKDLITCGLVMLKCYSCSLIVIRRHPGKLPGSLPYSSLSHFINIFFAYQYQLQKKFRVFVHLWFSEMYAKEAGAIAVILVH